MPEAMPPSNAQPMPGANHATYVRNERNVRVQDSPENSSVPDPRKPVDNQVPVFHFVRGHLVYGVPEAVAS